MDRITLATAPSNLLAAYQKAVRLPNENERLLALRDLIIDAPALVEARSKLRDLERKKLMSIGSLGRFFARFGSPVGKVKSLIKSNPGKAMALCEEALAKTLDNLPILELLAEAADQANAPFIAAEAMERAAELRPEAYQYTLKMATFLQKAGRAEEAMKRLHTLAANHLDNKEIQNAYRAAINADSKQREQAKSVAMAVVEKGGGANAIGSRSATILQLIENTIHDAAQARLVAAELQKILENGESMDVRKKLASAYLIMGDFDKAIREINKVIAANTAYDPTLDKHLEEAEIGKIDKEIAQIKRRPPKTLANPAGRIAELQAEREQLRLDHANSRIEHYPNDIGLVFDLGKLRLKRGEYDLAIEQFMKSRKSARCEIISRMGLAECYEKQGKYQEAVSELETVLSVLPRLDKERLPTTYALARIMETIGNKERALSLYKDLYDLEPRFRDVTERIKSLEGSNPQTADTNGSESAKE